MKKYKQYILESAHNYTPEDWYNVLKGKFFKIAQKMIDDGWNVNSSTSSLKYSSALLRCAFYERYDAMFFLLEQPNIDITVKDHDGNFIQQIIYNGIDPTKILNDYDLQKKIIDNKRYDIIKMLNDYNAINKNIREEYPHLFTGYDLGML